MKCAICGQEIYLPRWYSNICGTCSDELRTEEDAIEAQAITEEEARDRARWEADRGSIY